MRISIILLATLCLACTADKKAEPIQIAEQDIVFNRFVDTLGLDIDSLGQRGGRYDSLYRLQFNLQFIFKQDTFLIQDSCELCVLESMRPACSYFNLERNDFLYSVYQDSMIICAKSPITLDFYCLDDYNEITGVITLKDDSMHVAFPFNSL